MGCLGHRLAHIPRLFGGQFDQIGKKRSPGMSCHFGKFFQHGLDIIQGIPVNMRLMCHPCPRYCSVMQRVVIKQVRPIIAIIRFINSILQSLVVFRDFLSHSLDQKRLAVHVKGNAYHALRCERLSKTLD